MKRIPRVLIFLYSLLLIFTLLGCIFKEAEKNSPSDLTQKGEVTHPGRWILIEEQSDSLKVMEGQTQIKRYDNVAFGVAGVGKKKRRGDGITPRGTFYIASIRGSDKFHHFIQLSYPNFEYARNGYNEGRISSKELSSIESSLKSTELPLQGTKLGGNIGIHGVGKGSLKIHLQVNWTEGCIALTNEQVQDLIKNIRPGLPVEIR